MNTYNGDVKITKENQAEWIDKLKDIQKITGSVSVSGSAKAEFPVLAEVGGYVDVSGSATFPVLAEVGGSVSVSGSAKAEFPVLAEVGGSVDVYGSAKAEMPPRDKIGNKPKPIRETFAKKGYLLADGILTRIIKKRKSGKIVIYKTSKIGNRRKLIYVVQRGEQFAHGDTVKQATHDLRYKITDRDTTFCKKWNLDSVHPIEDVICAYRAITGACETGTKQWCEGKKFPTKLSVKIAIRATRGAYGAEKFAEFFNKKENK